MSSIYEIDDIVVSARIVNPSGTCGKATLVAGTVTVNTTAIDNSRLILLTRSTVSGTSGHLCSSNIVEGVSFDIDSSNALDTSTISWLLVN